MSIKTIHSTLLATGFTLTVAGAGFARQPPALSGPGTLGPRDRL